MKKIVMITNYVLVISAILGSYYLVLTRDNQLGLILKDSSIIITITLPYLIEFILRKKIPLGIKTFYILFVFLAQFLGVTIELYNEWAYFDKFTHWLSGILTALLSLSVLKYLDMYEEHKIAFNIIWMISITLAVASLWEFFEYIANIFFGGDAQRVALTGVNDTMQDMLVAFIGSILVSIMYVYEVICHKKIIVNSFVEEIV